MTENYTDPGVCSYHDNLWTWQLYELLGSSEELKRVNKWRSESRTQEEFDAMIRAAIKMREEEGLP